MSRQDLGVTDFHGICKQPCLCPKVVGNKLYLLHVSLKLLIFKELAVLAVFSALFFAFLEMNMFSLEALRMMLGNAFVSVQY